MKRLTPTQIETLQRMRDPDAGGRIVRRRGGYWTTPNTPSIAERDLAPTWYVEIRTLRALERAGLIERDPGPEWLADRTLTLAGEAAAEDTNPEIIAQRSAG